MYYLCSKNKGADKLHAYREADLHLCLCICENPVFSCCGSYISAFLINLETVQKTYQYGDAALIIPNFAGT